MGCGAFHSISALIPPPPQTTLRRQVSGHLAVNKVELIDFNSGQHPSAKHSPGSELNKLPPGTDFRSAVVIYVLWCVFFFFFGRGVGGGGICQVKKNRSGISIVWLNIYPYPNVKTSDNGAATLA